MAISERPVLVLVPGQQRIQWGHPGHLNSREVAQRLGCGERTVWRWAEIGRIPAPVRIGVHVRWREADIEDWIARGRPACGQSTRAGSRLLAMEG